MRRSELRRALQATLQDLTGVAVDLDDLLAQLDRNAGTERPPSDGGGGRSSGVSDPTARDAVHGRDPARQAREELDKGVQSLMLTARRLRELQQGWTATRPEGLPARCDVMRGVGVFEPRYRSIALDGEQRVLGRWASDWYGRHGRLPTAKEARLHAEGRKPRAAA